MDKIVCKKAGNYRVLTKNGFSDPFMTKDGKVCSQKYAFAALDVFKDEKYYSEPCRYEITFHDITYSYVVHKDAGNDDWCKDDYYFTKEDYEKIFRPFVYPHLQTKLFNEIEEMNKWLVDISPNRIRDIKSMVNPDALYYLVLYEEKGDE